MGKNRRGRDGLYLDVWPCYNARPNMMMSAVYMYKLYFVKYTYPFRHRRTKTRFKPYIYCASNFRYAGTHTFLLNIIYS